ncbi:hypothetical protein T03_9173 [Trichinella britovi]|uniref:Uncharacterized protein n=1 Tax=Trichinella britovi TaxID=45882 RepID=A0A0V1C7G5_TRIBR|nr:hypothetical protein T03_9173 [Trichinella britovi]
MISNGSWVILNFTKSITLKVIALQHKRIIELMKQLISEYLCNAPQIERVNQKIFKSEYIIQ